MLYVGKQLGFHVPVQGGSTLAIQLEKYRHSPLGRTESIGDKARQIVAASLKVYRPGVDPLEWRKTIILDYLNTMPLAAAPHYGEVYGLGTGLWVWFGSSLAEVRNALMSPAITEAKILSFKNSLALIVALRAPTQYLVKDRVALQERVDLYTQLLANAGLIEPAFAQAVQRAPLTFIPLRSEGRASSFVEHKDFNLIRTSLLEHLGISNVYDLDRLHLQVDTTIDTAWQREVTQLLQHLNDPEFVAAQGLDRDLRLLRGVDPRKVIYSALLIERTPEGNAIRVQTDTLNQPLDINSNIKLELGSTAKLRTLAHYLEIIALLHNELSTLPSDALIRQVQGARDPLTRWVAEILRAAPQTPLATVLEKALDRRYSASPGEAFFTGGGVHTFNNFARQDNGRIMTVREALQRSTNLVFIRLMRDLVRFHQARLPYDASAILTQLDHPERNHLLREAADEEARSYLWRAYQRYHGQSAEKIIAQLLGRRATSPRHLAILSFAWYHPVDELQLATWLNQRLPQPLSPVVHQQLWQAYSNPQLTLADYGYLLSRHPLELWCAGQLTREPGLSWQEIIDRSGASRQLVAQWLFKTRNRKAQDQRLRIRIERDAFSRMAPYWQQLGFPFAHLVPSYALAIGSGADRPEALADLMGIILNDGVRRPVRILNRLHFAEGTPYETVFTPTNVSTRVMAPAVATALGRALLGVVTAGTAQRVNGLFVGPDEAPVVVGGKTGSGDNQLLTVNRETRKRSVQAINRTATFVFYISDQFYGVLMAYVPGREAEAYHFTSALPVTILKLLAPSVNARVRGKEREPDNSQQIIQMTNKERTIPVLPTHLE